MSKDTVKIVAVVHGYFPNHNAGAEAMLHQILFDLKKRGHEVRVVTRDPGATEYEGIPIFQVGSKQETEAYRWSDIVFTHLDLTRYAVQNARRYGKRIVHLVHNDRQLSYHKVMDVKTADLAIANSDWIRKTVKRGIESIVVYPPTIPSRYEVETSKEAITLINLNENKGGNVLWQLARIFPEKKFIGVRGAYGEQIVPEKLLKNVEVLDNTPDIQDVYKRTGILIVPSAYESWGRVAMEAACSGIPVIASPTPGLTESLDYAGIFSEPNDIAGYVEAIRMLDDEKSYSKYSKLVKKRSKEVSAAFEQQMDILEKKLVGLLPVQ